MTTCHRVLRMACLIPAPLSNSRSELDPLRQEYVLNRIAGGQVFITCCENDRLDTLLNGKVFYVKNGEVL